MIVMHNSIIDFTAKTASFPLLEVIVEDGSEFHDLELELFDVLGRIWKRINPVLVVDMP